MKLRSRTKRILVSIAAMAAAVVAPLQAGQQTLTLSEAVKRTLEQNPELAADDPARAAAESEIAASRAGYFPRLDFDQLYTGGNNPIFVFGTLLTQRRFTEANFALPSLNRPDAVDNLQTRISAQQTIWDFGRTGKRVEAAQLGLKITDQTHDEHVNQVLLGTIGAYYAVSLARNALDTAHLAVQSAESIVSQARSRVESGLAVEADMLRAEVYLANARQREIDAAGRLEIARATLNRIMGEPLDAQLGETAGLVPVSIPIPSQNTLLEEQRRNRPEYLRMLTEVQQAEVEVRSRKANYWPVLGAFANWEMDNPSLREYGGNNWTAGVDLRWNIFAGGSDTAQVQAARHRLEQKKRQLAAMESALSLEIHQAVVQVRSAEQQVEATEAAETQSEEGLRILRNRYDAGLATMTDLLSAETARSAARTDLANAIYRHRTSYAQLEFAAGILSPTSTAMNP